jgi:N-acyl-phosphatidylethanolamine-hydrolysing phospholipase D
MSSVPVEPSIVTPAAAHHRADGGFQNPWPSAELHGFLDVLRWKAGDKRPKGRPPSPPYGSLPTRRSIVISPRATPGYRSVTWVGHSTVLLQLGALNVLTDPVWSERASPFQWIGPRRLMPPALEFDALPPIDVVLLSHNHYDHLDAPTVRRLAKRFPGAAWLCPLRLGELLASLGVRYIIERDWWQTVDTPDFSATCTPAQHFSARGVRDRGDTLWCGWTISADGVRMYFAGDTALHPEFGAIGERAGPFDLVMLPIGAYEPRWFMRSVHMNPEDAIEAYRALAASQRSMPPCLALHWGTFRLTDEAVEEPPALFARLWNEAGFDKESNWTFAHGETRKL